MNRQLIVNADDYNTDSNRNRGILEAARRGIVTSTSVLANVGWPEGALSELKAVFDARAGVHLNLTKGKPLCQGIASITGSDGSFFTKPIAWSKALNNGFDCRQVEREFTAQIQALHAIGIRPDHIDGNNHIHIFPKIVQVTARLAVEFGIRRVRLPLEPLSWSLMQLSGRGLVKKCLISLLALRARAVFRNAELCFPDRCAGLNVPDMRCEAKLICFLERLPAGTTELMCHPGYQSADNAFSTADRERELLTLVAAGVADAVTNNNIRLIAFSDVSCE